MGNNNQLYRGRIDTCEQISLKKAKEIAVKTRDNIEQQVDLHIDQFDQSNQKIIDEHLLEYLDWHVQFTEQVFLSYQKQQKTILFFQKHRIYLMNFVKNYLIIGHRLFVKINPVIVIHHPTASIFHQ